MKRGISLFLTIILSFSFVLTGCKKDDDPIISENPPIEEYNPNEGEDLTSEKHYLVQNGESNGYAIVYPNNSEEVYENAAIELQQYVKQVTGVTVPVKTDNELSGGNKFISIGQTSQLKSSGFTFDYTTLNGDGFYMYSKDDNVYITANTGRGHLYGAYEFIERFLGVKFLTEEYYYIPESEDVYFHDLTIKSVPAFKRRDFHQTVSGQDFFAKMRFIDPYDNLGAKYGYGYSQTWAMFSGLGHTIMELVKYDDYGAAHPEWFTSGEYGHVLDFTHGMTLDGELDETMPDSAVKTLIQNTYNKLVECPDAQYIMIGQNDGQSYPTSEYAKQMSAKYNDVKSAVLMLLINLISREVNKMLEVTFPGREVTYVTFSYVWGDAPPVTENSDGSYSPMSENVVAEEDVMIMVAPLDYCYLHAYEDENCDINKTWMKKMDGWQTICKRYTVWDYQTNFSNYLWWYPHYSSMKANLEHYQRYGFEELLHQAGESYNFYQRKLDTYVYSKLSWNLNRSVNDLVSEFNRYYFGEKVGKIIDEYYNYMNMHFSVISATKGYHARSYNEENDSTLYPIEFLEKACQYINDAIYIVNNDNTLTGEQKNEYYKRLIDVLVQPEYMILKNYASYYSTSTKYDFVVQFMQHANLIGLTHVKETQRFDSYIAELGY